MPELPDRISQDRLQAAQKMFSNPSRSTQPQPSPIREIESYGGGKYGRNMPFLQPRNKANELQSKPQQPAAFPQNPVDALLMTHFNTDPQHPRASSSASLVQQTPTVHLTAALQTQLPNTGQTQNAAPDLFKGGLEWAQHQYQSGQEQVNTWGTQLRQSPLGQKIAPAWDIYQKADQQAHDSVNGFAKGIDPTIRSWMDTTYDGLNQPLNFIDDKTKNIPILGTLSHGITDNVRTTLQVGTGANKWAGGLIGGLASLAADPGAAVGGLYTIAEHSPTMGVNPLKMLHGFYDVVVNGEDYNSRMNRVFDPKASMNEDLKVGNALLGSVIDPMKQSWQQGKPVEAITQGGLEIVSWFVGAGEVRALSEASRAAEAARLATGAERTAEVARGTEIAEGAGAATKLGKGVEVANTADKVWTGTKSLAERAVVGAKNWSNRALNAADHLGYEAQNWLSNKFPGLFGEPELAGIRGGLERPTPRLTQSVPEKQPPLRMDSHNPGGQGPSAQGKGTTPQSETGNTKGKVNPSNGESQSDLVFEASPKHTATDKGNISHGPSDGQTALNNSVQVKSTSTRRVGLDKETGEIVVFDETTPGIFHGHVRSWEQLRPEMQNALRKAGLVDRRGKIIE
jgi:hypothetical protein